jgi:hypothetical protein
MATDAFNLQKHEGRVRAGLLHLDGMNPVFVKRTEARSRGRAFVEALLGSRARRALAGAALLDKVGFAHAAPLAVMEDRTALGAVRTSYLLSEALINARTFSVYALGRRGELRHDMRRRIAISDAVSREVRRLHDAGLFTRDLQETNLMLEQLSDGLKIYFVDLEDFRRTRRVSKRRRMINLIHLDRSIGRFVGRADRLRFLYGYLGGRPTRHDARKIVARLGRIRYSLDRRRVSGISEGTTRLRRPIVEG